MMCSSIDGARIINILQTVTGRSLALALLLACTSFTINANTAATGFLPWTFTYQKTRVDSAIWYPAEGNTERIVAGPFTLRTVNTDISTQVSRRLPLILISHGTGGSALAHHTLAESIAAAGYLVAAIEHPGDNYKDRSLVANRQYFEERPRQLLAMLNAMLYDEQLSAIIDRQCIGALGHSVGGYTVFALVGAKPDRAGLIRHCATVDDDPACNYADPDIGVTATGVTSFQLQPDKTADIKVATRQVIKSAVALAPLGSVVDSHIGLDESVPVSIVTAQHDTILPSRYHLSKLSQIAPHAVITRAKGAGHFSFISPVNENWHNQLAEVAKDPLNFNRYEFHNQLGAQLVQWFDTTLAPAICHQATIRMTK